MNHLLFVLMVLLCYLVAAIPTGIVLAKVLGYEDVRGKGSGNIGATNVYRVAGKLPGVLTLLGDILKGLLPLLMIDKLLEPSPLQLGILAAVAIVGHCYPVYLRFKGGKGVATALGIFLVVAPFAVIGAAVVFLLTVGLSRFISLGSVLAALSMPLLVLFLERPQPIVAGTLFIALLVIWRHRANIKRLLEGSENRFKL
ncbi:MAG: acyl-phosphate glycerol 3-phosphate acyltransferase [Desulfuromonas sp.]|nr:MAG: acyl-phosphate glycerol 3-phosphate acyltransferase [Desulfuromonas sp.]